MLNNLKAGISIIDISPEKGVELAGYPHCPRNNTGIHDPLYAGCIFLDNGYEKVVIVTLDILFYSKKYVAETRKSIAYAVGIPENNIMICCSHTHSGPWAAGRLDLEALEKGLKCDEVYIKGIQEKLCTIIKEATENTFDAKIGFGVGKCGSEQGIGGNRRNPDGVCDPSVNVVGVKDMNDNWKGCLINYALHPTVIHSESTVVTADYPAYIRRFLNVSKPGIKMLFAQGTSGDQSTRYYRDGQNFEEACRIGTTIGVEANKVLEMLTFSSDVKLSVLTAIVQPKFRQYPDINTAKNDVTKAHKSLEALRSENAKYIDIRNSELKLLGAEDILGYILLEEKGIKPDLLVDEVPFELQVLAIGEARIVGLPGEYFVEFGLDIKRRSPSRFTFVFELANGAAPGYIYTKDALKLGGYETDTSMLSEECGYIITDASVELLNSSS